MNTLRQSALALYRPPFRFDGGGYVYDSAPQMVSDQDRGIGETAELVAARVRGWGRIQKIIGEHTPEDLQDEFGRVMADALNEYYARREWQPMETAPRDETRVILLLPDDIVTSGGFWEGVWLMDAPGRLYAEPVGWLPLPQTAPEGAEATP